MITKKWLSLQLMKRLVTCLMAVLVLATMVTGCTKRQTQQEAILALCQLISVNILEIQDQQVENHHFTTRAEEVFKAFLRLVPQHFMEHRELSFYADLLNITTTYLSRIVRQMSGRTVLDFLVSALVSEAAIRLKTTNRSITQLADDFHFSDQAAFTKFFTRMKGISPKKFRKGK